MKDLILKILKEELGPSPLENDIISELQELIDTWGDSPIKEEVQDLINKYISQPLNEIDTQYSGGNFDMSRGAFSQRTIK